MANNNETEAPRGWVAATIDRVISSDGVFCDGDWVESKDQDPDGTVRLIQLADIGDGEFLDKSARFLTKKKAYELNCTFLAEGDLLIARMPDPLGRACIFPLSGKEKFVTVVDVCVVRVDNRFVNVKYLMHVINSPALRTQIESFKSGSTRKRISRGNLARVQFPVSPRCEQDRVVARIEALLSELDKGVQSLKTAREQLEVYRQSILKHAFEGKLTERWRVKNESNIEDSKLLMSRIEDGRASHYQERLAAWNDSSGKNGGRPRLPKILAPLAQQLRDELPALPHSWCWEKLGWMTCGVEYGTAAKSSKAGSIPVLRMGNIQNAKFDWSDLVYTSDEKEIRKYSLCDGDVLFNRTNSPELVGKTAVLRGDRPALFAGYLIRINQIPTIADSQFLNLFLNSHIARQHGIRVKTDGVNQSNINGDKLSNYPFPYCSLAEQCEIVRLLDEKLSVVDQLEEDIDFEIQKAAALRRSILNRAFAGKLAMQDVRDEPASVLLERIRVEKVEAEKRNKKMKRRVAA